MPASRTTTDVGTGKEMAIVERIATWVASLDPADVPASAVKRARLQAAGMVAAARAGARAGSVVRLKAATRKSEGRGPCQVVGERYRLTPAIATYANAAASIVHDWDDYLYMGHAGHSSVWASRAVGESVAADPEQVMVAQIAANEVCGRLGAALLLGPHNGQFWSSIHCAGAAVAAAKVLGLDEYRTAHALATSLYQPPYGLWPGFMGPDTKILTAAEPAAQGVRAAYLAAEGFTGPLDVIEHPGGLLASLAYHGRPGQLEALGTVWLTETIAFKPRPGCAYLQGAVEGTLSLIEEHGIQADDVHSIEVEASLLTAAMEGLSRGAPLTSVRVNFSVALSLAVALVAGRLSPEELDEEYLAANERQLRDLAARVCVRHDLGFTLELIEAVTTAADSSTLLADVPLRIWPRMSRRMSKLSTGGPILSATDLRRLLGHPAVRRALAGVVHSRIIRGRQKSTAHGMNALDTEKLRMSFPARVRIYLKDGSTVNAVGRESGGMGSTLVEAREVVERKWLSTGGSAGDFAEITRER